MCGCASRSLLHAPYLGRAGLFKGWSITIASGLAASAAVESRTALLVPILGFDGDFTLS